MHNTKKITDDLIFIGANDRRLAMFEGIYSVKKGVSYNSYLLLDEKIVIFDTVDKAVYHRFIENLTYALGERKPDYLVVQHMEPDHSAGLSDLVVRYPNMTIICNRKTLELINQFNSIDISSRVQIVGETNSICTGRHTLHFLMAPMVHWPEVMLTYDSTDKILFSADAFGCFGALNGAMFADEVDFERDYMDEARRYYTNIVGKYGTQVEMLLNKASAFEIDMICPLHGFVWRQNKKSILTKYQLWSSYEAEEKGVMIAYASVYGNTENAAEILSSLLRDKGIKTEMFDVSVTVDSQIVAAAFKYSHLVFASTTYNAGIFVAMESLINDLVAHNISNRTVAIIENGSWAATAGRLIREKLERCKNISFIDRTIKITSSLKEHQLEELSLLADEIAFTLIQTEDISNVVSEANDSSSIDKKTLFKLSYGLFVLSARDNNKDNGCIINTVTQVSENPLRITIAVNKANFTHDMIVKTKVFNVSILSEATPFSIFERYGYCSGRDTDKFGENDSRTKNGLVYVTEYTNTVISANVEEIIDLGSHSLFIAAVTDAITLSDLPSATYSYYFDNIKPKPQIPKEVKKGYICKMCGYIYEGDKIPDDFICPLCKHGVDSFERL